jgi:Domain of unknown function (DUF4252)
MRISPDNFMTRLVLGVALLCITLPGVAQAGKLQLQNLEKLADKAAEVNDVTLDGSLLSFAVTVLKKSNDPDSAQLVELIRGLKGIYVKNFEFDSPGQYSQADVEAIRSQLAGPGWQRIVTSFSKRSNERDEVYLLKEGDKINGVAILVAEAKELTVVNIVGAIDPEKLGELGGHFGIPAEIYEHPGVTQSDHPKRKPTTKKEGEKTTSDKKETSHEIEME